MNRRGPRLRRQRPAQRRDSGGEKKIAASVMFIAHGKCSREEAPDVATAAAQYSFDQCTRVPRRLRQLRANPRERLGLSSHLWPFTAAEHGRGGGSQLPGHLRKPAAGQGSARDSAAERRAV